jgi:hypothetical protein
MPEILPGGTAEKIRSILMSDIVGEYDTPDQVPEWAWIERNASFAHIGNGKQPGVHEFVLNLALSFKDIPERLSKVIADARRNRISYLILHQGT